MRIRMGRLAGAALALCLLTLSAGAAPAAGPAGWWEEVRGFLGSWAPVDWLERWGGSWVKEGPMSDPNGQPAPANNQPSTPSSPDKVGPMSDPDGQAAPAASGSTAPGNGGH